MEAIGVFRQYHRIAYILPGNGQEMYRVVKCLDFSPLLHLEKEITMETLQKMVHPVSHVKYFLLVKIKFQETWDKAWGYEYILDLQFLELKANIYFWFHCERNG